MTVTDQTSATPTPPGLPWRAKLAVVLLVILAVVVVLVSNRLLTDRYTADTKSRAEVRLALYTGNLMAELQRTSVVPLLLASDPDLGTALKDGNFSGTSAKLIALQDELGVASIRLVDADGRVVGATNRNVLGTNHRNETYFVAAQRAKDTIFSAVKREAGGFDFLYSRAVMVDSKAMGVIIVSVDLMKYERAWAGLQDAILVTDSEGTVMLSTEPRWRGLPDGRRFGAARPALGDCAGLAGDGGMDAGPARRLCARRGGDEDRSPGPVPGLEDRDLHPPTARSANR